MMGIQEIESLPYRELQRRAKALGIRANAKASYLREEILKRSKIEKVVEAEEEEVKPFTQQREEEESFQAFKTPQPPSNLSSSTSVVEIENQEWQKFACAAAGIFLAFVYMLAPREGKNFATELIVSAFQGF